jgi:hypothetical protein
VHVRLVLVFAGRVYIHARILSCNTVSCGEKREIKEKLERAIRTLGDKK